MATNKKFTQRISMGRTFQALIVSHIMFDEMGFGKQIQGLVPIQIPEDKTPKEMLEVAAKFRWNLLGAPNAQNNFVPTVTRGEELSADVLDNAVLTGSSISVELEIEESAVEQNA